MVKSWVARLPENFVVVRGGFFDQEASILALKNKIPQEEYVRVLSIFGIWHELQTETTPAIDRVVQLLTREQARPANGDERQRPDGPVTRAAIALAEGPTTISHHRTQIRYLLCALANCAEGAYKEPFEKMWDVLQLFRASRHGLDACIAPLLKSRWAGGFKIVAKHTEDFAGYRRTFDVLIRYVGLRGVRQHQFPLAEPSDYIAYEGEMNKEAFSDLILWSMESDGLLNAVAKIWSRLTMDQRSQFMDSFYAISLTATDRQNIREQMVVMEEKAMESLEGHRVLQI
ncbi:hypothetical protein QR680_000846 [Steinernema hermaphroditum]|uniref:Uncharacterized protein n=1 Tax=Steinernema hermaphroditum TaxID=289476 RepID=A0AA39GY26_9BILA|nr:hypothetical protein QR680_000846 [Steinernema hermaphroditum]